MVIHRRLSYDLLILLFLGLSPVLSIAQSTERFSSDITAEKKPWTHLDFYNDPDNFQFAIISDRTGSPRPGIFEDAIRKLNWLMPEFVVSVGDLIRGAKGNDSITLAKQWDAHFERIEPLRMPFFHLAGNHDIKANNDFQLDYWNRLFGVSYYSFVYKDVLFLCLFTNEGTQILSEEQVEHFQNVLEQHQDVRWTMVFMHHPLWRYPHDSNFDQIEASLSDRKYTVFAGHQHHYHHSTNNESNYYVLATTGGGSELLGNSFGTFDHVTWVTMSEEGPVIANLRLDGILPHDVANSETEELTQELLKSVQVQTNVLVDSKTAFKNGRAYLTYKNDAELPLFLEGRFFHSHHVIATPAHLDVEIPPKTSKTIPVQLQAITPFHLKEKIQLEFEGSIGYESERYPDLRISGTVRIPLKSSNYPLFPTKEVEFIEEYTPNITLPLPNTHIVYTVNGQTPNATSPILHAPLKITEPTTLKARLVSVDGWMSEVDQVTFKPILPGKGLMVKKYIYHGLGKFWNYLPDFSKLQPESIFATTLLDPTKVAEESERFALVYKGYIELPESGEYKFSVVSDDAIKLLINEKEVVSDPIKHKSRQASGSLFLQAGKHPIEIQYFQFKRNYALEIVYILPNGTPKSLSSEVLSYDQHTILSH